MAKCECGCFFLVSLWAAMVEVVVQAGRPAYLKLKRRVEHYTAIAVKQRTGI